ncbi:YbaB/EbfC family nucleoid-associated protein [Micromonospora sp. DT31]|uniref:YbaB/EbfC family nucleoid-associated protein n=1 Tax=Micromonospora sp. DT31 TaxID=3393434 RepID=UPI003CF33614
MAERLSDLYARMKVTTRSPDRTVTVIVTGNGRVSIELDPSVQRLHTVKSLEKQLNAVARVGVMALRQARSQALDRVMAQSKELS